MSEVFTFKMPDIGEGVVEGEVVSWLKKEGDLLAKDEPVLILMTDKATVELPTPYAGVLLKTYYRVGDVAKKDFPLFDVKIEGHVINAPQDSPTVNKIESVEIKSSGKALASPPVRKLASDLGISLDLVEGSGPSGRVLKEDLKRHSHSAHIPVIHLSGDQEKPITGIQNLMKEKMEASSREIPHFSYFDKADATRLVQLREKMLPEAAARNVKLTFMPFFIKALSLTLQQYPKANSSIDSEKNTLIVHAQHNVGIAMTTPFGLIVPVLKGVEKLTLFEIVFAYEALKEKAKNNKLAPSDMKEGTITLTNYGALAGPGTLATPIINLPEVAILGVSRIEKEPVNYQGELALRDLLHCSWSFDHRVIDGDMATHLSHAYIRLIENPGALL